MRKFTLLFVFSVLLSVFGVKAQVVISQVYGGGGNSGATYTHDYIELYNRGTSPVDISAWSLQYASSTGTFSASNTHGFAAGTIIQPGKYFLVQEGKGTGGTTALPNPDLIPTTVLNISGTNGKVALANSTTPVTGPTDATVIDFVGFGTANQYEGSGAVPALTNTTAAIRNNNGATDTNDNKNDFTTGTTNPRNSTYGSSASAAPSITPPTGNIYTPITVTITAGTGASIYYTTDGSVPSNTSTIYTDPFTVSSTTTVKAIAYETGKDPSAVTTATYTLLTATEIPDIAGLRQIALPSTDVYKLTGEAVLTLQSATRNSKYIQDATGAILIDDVSKKITTVYNLGDGITGIIGTLVVFNGMLQFTPVADPGAPTSTGKTITPLPLSLGDLSSHQAELVKVSGVTISDVEGGTGAFVVSKSYNLNAGTNPVLRTQYGDLDYIGQTIPAAPQDMVGVVLVYGTTTQFVPRSMADMITTGVAKTNLQALNLWTAAGKINFNATAGDVVEVYNTLGQRIYNAAATDGQNQIEAGIKGVAIVKVGNRVGKVIL